jgi:hypothetical protein
MAIGFFDGQKADASPENIKRRREMMARLLSGNSRAPRNIGEGFQAIGNNLAAVIEGAQADREEKEGRATADALIARIMGGGAPMAAVGGAPVASGIATGSAATGPAPRASRGGPIDPSIRDGIASTASALGISPVDLATAISYETGGTFDPTKRGPTTQWGQHKGLIQFGQPQAKQHGVDWNDPVGSQLGPNGAVASYLRSTGVRPGMGLLDIYSAINAGGVGRYNRTDANNGGAPGTVRDKVEQQMAGHRARALAMFQQSQAPNVPAVSPGNGATAMSLADMPAPGANPSAMEPMPQGGPPMAPGGGVPIANNEQDVQFLEARMAAEQAAAQPQMPPPEMPNAQNAGDVFSPIPMGLGGNPFVQRAPFAPAPDQPAPMAQEAAINPQAMAMAAPAPMIEPPPPENIQPVEAQPRPAMMQPMAPNMGGENGASPVQFIESEFARREGRPDPRMAMGAPMAQAPQMPAGGPPMASDAAPMAQGQPQGGGMNMAALGQFLNSPFVSAENKRMVLAQFEQQRATQQAEAERARVAEQNRRVAQDLNIPESLAGVAPVVTARAQQMFAKPEGATSDQRELMQVNRERQAAGLPTMRMDEYKIQKAQAGATSITNNVGGKADEKFAEQFASGDAKALGEIATAGMAARRNVSRIDRLEELMNANPTGGMAALQSRAGEFGINTKGLSEIQAAQALINSLVPEQRQPGSGPMSDADLALFKESLPRIINQPDGNRRIIDTMRGIAKYDAEGAAVVQQLREGKLNRAQAFEMLQNRANPLAEFNRPPARPASKAEFDALKSGDTFIAPDGTTRRKP